MRVAHLLRKYNPTQWGGTETAVKRLLDGLAPLGVQSVVFSPKLDSPPPPPRAGPSDSPLDPLFQGGHASRQFRSFLPVWRLTPSQREQLISIGGNLMSFDLFWMLFREPHLDVIHTHTTNRLGGIALTLARLRRCPLIVTIHGGILDLPAAVRQKLVEPLKGGIEWGRIFGWLLRSRRVLERADAIVTCNRREAALLSRKYPAKPVIVQPHSVPLELYAKDHLAAAIQAFPQIVGRPTFLAAGRIDPVKNQAWLLQQWPAVLQRHPAALLVLTGPCTDVSYGETVRSQIQKLGLENHVLLTGPLTPDHPQLVGLFQHAAALLLPSLSETFGLVVLETWAAGRPVIATPTSGVLDLVQDNVNGWLFNLNEPSLFHSAIDTALSQPQVAASLGLRGREQVAKHHNAHELAARIRNLYQWLTEEKRNEVRNPSRR